MAEPQQNPSPSNQRKDLITRFREDYAHALLEASVSEIHTATDGWQKLYAGHIREEQEQEQRRELAGSLKKLATQMEEFGLDENSEKELGEIKKSSVTLRERQAAFESQTIDPVRRPATECERVIEEGRRAARLEEANAPLMNVGLEEVMKDAIGELRRVKWNSETGRLTIREPGETD